MVEDLHLQRVLAALQHRALLDPVVVRHLELGEADGVSAVLEARLATGDLVQPVLEQLDLVVSSHTYPDGSLLSVLKCEILIKNKISFRT